MLRLERESQREDMAARVLEEYEKAFNELVRRVEGLLKSGKLYPCGSFHWGSNHPFTLGRIEGELRGPRILMDGVDVYENPAKLREALEYVEKLERLAGRYHVLTKALNDLGAEIARLERAERIAREFMRDSDLADSIAGERLSLERAAKVARMMLYKLRLRIGCTDPDVIEEIPWAILEGV